MFIFIHPYSVSAPTGVLQFILGMNHLELTQTPQVKGPIYKTVISSDQVATNLGDFLSPMIFDNSLEWFIEPKKALNLWLQFYKWYNLGTAK